jgi:hypothetical protein
MFIYDLFNVSVTQTYRPVSSKCRMILNKKFDRKQKAAACGLLQVGLLSWFMGVPGLSRLCPNRDRYVQGPYKYIKVKVQQSLYRPSHLLRVPEG